MADGADRWALSWGMDREARPWKADCGRARPASRNEQKMTGKQTALGKKLVSRIRSRPWTTLQQPGRARPDLRKRREAGEQGELTAEERLDRPGTTRQEQLASRITSRETRASSAADHTDELQVWPQLGRERHQTLAERMEKEHSTMEGPRQGAVASELGRARASRGSRRAGE
ncbi:hypothetical protein ZEAMMB73_Zm00001d004114 [Zea mays]|jgi:hypothetical protein|uniref:Uncharacterized protein n=1 Tax=Zea mays TaxID=4577 RepID=A0A1D6EDH1_MAIZE|nr:hypothetical protein ZEAMMB73_Zm00001d004114 [Zea mays]